MKANRRSYGVVGALEAFPLRLAARHAESSGAKLHRGLTRKTSHAVFGRGLLRKSDDATIEHRIEQARDAGVELLSERAFLRLVGQLPDAAPGDIKRQSLIDQSGLSGQTVDRLALFDAFESSTEPFSFRDLILARKYAGLVATGAGWGAIARALHDVGPVGSLTAVKLRTAGIDHIVIEDAHSLAELDGQRLLDFGPADDEAEDYFGLAEQAEAAGLWAEAATLYGHCAALDGKDATAPFNQGNCLRAAGDLDGAEHAYASAIKRDGEFVEAWFNYGGVLRDEGKTTAARKHLQRAIALDPSYADAIYNLAALEFDAGEMSAARELWKQYLALDDDSDWARRARAGVALADRELRRTAG
ncbi:MAG TPA: tetratricopeptide repeat protein [Devosia sp.]